MIISAKIDVTKLLKEKFFKGKNGAFYADITLLENRDGTDQYGNDFMVVQDLGKEARQAGEKGPILGNGRILGAASPKPRTAQPAREAASAPEKDDCPF